MNIDGTTHCSSYANELYYTIWIARYRVYSTVGSNTHTHINTVQSAHPGYQLVSDVWVVKSSP